MRQITIELPLETLPAGSIPEELLKKALTIRFLRLDFSGFLFACRVPKDEAKNLVRALKEHYKQVPQGNIKVSFEAQDMLVVSGQWWNDGRTAYSQEENFAKLDAIYRSRTNFLKSPEILEKNLRITLVGDSESLKVLQNIFRKVGLNYKVTKLCEFEKNVESVLDILTPQQMRVFRLAYAEGYYNIPRKASTEQLASLLRIDKGTVGEHLRRAEKKMLDYLMAL